MKIKNRTIVAAVLVSQDNQILLGKVRKGGVYPDCWHIPGGGVEENETKTEALNREIKEEVGLDIGGFQVELLSDSDTGEAVKTEKETGEEWLVRMQFNTYRVDLPSPAVDIVARLQDDMQEYRWVPMDELSRYKHTPPSEKLFKHLGWI